MRTMFTPLKIAGMEVKNRTFMAPMSLGYESQDGTVNEKMELTGSGVRKAVWDVSSETLQVLIRMFRILEIHFVFGMKKVSKNTKALQTKFILMAVRSFRRLRIRVRKVSVHFSE